MELQDRSRLSMDCGVFLSKFVLFGFNTIVCVLSIVIMVVSSVVLYRVGAIGEVATYPALGVFLGVTTFVISFLGCCGSIKESYCMVTVYMISMMILLIVFAVVAAIAFNEVRENQGHNDERNIFSRIWRNKDHRGNTAIINSIQTYCECCGKHGPSDWVFESRLIPPSCCSQVGVTICNQSIAYQTGCIERIEESVHYVAYLCLIFAIVCLLGFLMSYNLKRHVSEIDGYRQLYV